MQTKLERYAAKYGEAFMNDLPDIIRTYCIANDSDDTANIVLHGSIAVIKGSINPRHTFNRTQDSC